MKKNICIVFIFILFNSINVLAKPNIDDPTKNNDLVNNLNKHKFIISHNCDNASLTIYGYRGSLVNEIRQLELKAGINDIIFENMPISILTDSVNLFNADDMKPMSVKQQVFVSNLENIDKSLLSLFEFPKILEDKEVTLVYPANSGVSIKGTYLKDDFINTSDGVVLPLKNRYFIFHDLDPKIFYSQKNDIHNLKPFYHFKVEVPKDGLYKLNLFYMMDGINWNYTHSIILDNDKTLSLSTKANINNETRQDFRNVKLSLIAGRLNSGALSSHSESLNNNDVTKTQSASFNYAKSYNNYSKYVIPYKCNLLYNQDNLITLSQKFNINYTKYLHNEAMLWYSTTNEETSNPDIILEINNNTKNNLGILIPNGKAIVFQKDAASELTYLGTSYVSNNNPSQNLKLTLGRSYDTRIVRKVVASRPVKNKDNTTYIITVVYEIDNFGLNEENLHFVFKTANPSKIIKASQKYETIDVDKDKFMIHLKPNSKQTLKIDLEMYVPR